MCEEREEAEDSDNIKLHSVMHHSFRQRVQPKEKDADAHYRHNQNNRHENEQDVGITRCRYEWRQMMRSCRMY
jgi:hypothetical protein